ncbi:hypothetical protein HMJ29_10855 [Hymenobacter taeanensis]|uniref:Lipoprotein n=1 Tax=Hymenobacter taeanensis TaxID=2735321 RepID=A0A6M6BHN1_9BACT|nr:MULTISPECIES: hypothetical protein [Hymenobacter]QJX47408.1 hypothetical protein HMJ29_10855 [Hymenobacter taeanensis]UOQ79252.1 hypothetical protein MUN83_10260 [Hymenobacter sp. 5414T-23]
MKNHLKFPAFFLALLLSAATLTGCVATAQPGGVVVSPAPAPYPYYSYGYPYRARPYYRPRPARVVVVEPRRPVVVQPRRHGVVPAQRPYYNSYNVRPHRSYRVR